MTPREDGGSSDRGLWAFSVFAAMLSAAGLPLYIHAPKFFVDSYGVGLSALGSVLFLLRLIDVVQDPALGWLAKRLRTNLTGVIAFSVTVLAASMFGLFAVTPPIAPLIWFGVMIALIFTSFSFLTICLYAQGVSKALLLGASGHVRVARWRETGALLGICCAAIFPVLALGWSNAPFSVYAICFALISLCAVIGMRGQWTSNGPLPTSGFRAVFRDAPARRLLFVAFLNASPVAMTSTLFLFFVESRIEAVGYEGVLLLLFFLAAAIAAPIWTGLAQRFGAKRVLLLGMVLSVVSFAFALSLGAGDIWAFALICTASGFALGADMTLLPALFARRLAEMGSSAAEGFGLWSFMSKATLAFAAVLVLPALDRAGFVPGPDNSAEALKTLSFLYAGVPCVLKLLAMWLLARTSLHEAGPAQRRGETV